MRILNKCSSTKDLTTGKPMKLILVFLLPLLGGLLFQQLYSMVDTMIVGKTLGKDALAGVGATGSINFMVVWFCIGVCTGFAIPIAQQFGAKKYSEMRCYFANSIFLTFVFALIITFGISLLIRPILMTMNTPNNVFDYSYKYIRVIFWGLPVVFLYNLSSSVIRALGDSATPVLFLIIASLLNICLDLLFIIGLNLGVEGAAWATNISQLFAGVLCCMYIKRKIPLLQIRKEEKRASSKMIKVLLYAGIPMGLQYSITAIGAAVLQTAVNGLGSDYVATMTTGSKISLVFCTPFDAIGTTMTTWAGQNIGAKKPQRLNEGIRASSVIGIVYSVVAFTVLSVFGGKFATLFISTKESLILENIRLFLICNSGFYVLLLYINILRFIIQGMGYSNYAIAAGVCEMIARVAVALIIMPKCGFMGACLANPIAWIAADSFLIPAYIILRKRIYRELGMKSKVKVKTQEEQK